MSGREELNGLAMDWEVVRDRESTTVIGRIAGEQRLRHKVEPRWPVRAAQVRKIVRARLEQIIREGSIRG